MAAGTKLTVWLAWNTAQVWRPDAWDEGVGRATLPLKALSLSQFLVVATSLRSRPASPMTIFPVSPSVSLSLRGQSLYLEPPLL